LVFILGVVPEFVAGAITGHSIEVQRRHYAHIAPDPHLRQLADYRYGEAAQKAAHPCVETSGSNGKHLEGESSNRRRNQSEPELAGIAGSGAEVGDKGFEYYSTGRFF
jgi:hypothetical protein